MDFSAFKAYDIRGVYPSEVSEVLAFRVGNVLAGFEEVILVGGDIRGSTDSLKKSFIKGALIGGAKIVDIGIVPNPVFGFSTYKKGVLGAYITASHNPVEYNGIKLFRNGIGDIDTQNRVLEVLKEGFVEEKKDITGVLEKDFSSVSKYINNLKSKVGSLPSVRVGIDCLNAAGGLIIRDLMKVFNIDAVILNEEPLPDFGGRTPVPDRSTAMHLGDVIREKGLDVGFIFDGDADRCLVLDGNGREIPSDYLVLKMKEALGYSKIIASIDMTGDINKVNHEWSKVGHTYLEPMFKDSPGSIGAEASHHYYFGDFYPFSDAFLVIFKVLELMNKVDLKTIISPGIKFNLKKEFNSLDERQIFYDHLQSSLKKRSGVTINELDGVRIDAKDYWFIMRLSNTQPLIRILGEAKTKEKVEEISRLLE